jgi:F1F0 ATPase subunit 2
MMDETLSLVLSLVAGILLGAFFFGGLWWTVQKVVSSNRSTLWFFVSLLMRTSIRSGWFLFYRARSLGAAADVSPRICRGASNRDGIHSCG